MTFQKSSQRIWLENESGQTLAEVQFPIEKDGIHNITHTITSPSLRGQGVAGKMMKEVAEQLRSSGYKTRLTCSYAVRWFEQHPEYSDIIVKK